MSEQNKSLVWTLFILAIATPLYIRYLNQTPIIPLDTSYSHFLTSTSLYDVLLQVFPSPALPVFLGLVTFFLLTIILKGKKYALVLFAITPLIITTFTSYNAASLFLPLALCLYLLGRRNPYLALLAIPLLMFTDYLAGLIVSLAAIIAFIAAERRRAPAVTAFVVLAMSFLVCVRTGFGVTTPELIPLFGEFGSAFGYSVFILLLGLVFLVQHWRTVNASIVLLWLVAFVLSAYFVTLRPLVLLPVVIYAAQALTDLTRKQWQLRFLKQASFFLLICLGVFVLITHMKFLVEATPQAPLLSILEHANQDVRPGGILTTTEYEHLLTYYGTRPVTALTSEDEFWDSVTLSDARDLLIQNKIRFIAINPQTIPDEGLYFFIRNNDKFVLVRESETHELWLVLTEFL